MAIINVLDKQTSELIAAGEVVEKPASVVKELVENSIDAGAKNIIVDIENGGIRKILVQDDGCGIDSEYVKTAFIRHATSKISNGADLDHIHSLGFRGEALASIASVSKLTLITKTQEQDFGIEIALSGGDEENFCVKPFVDGSRFIIKDLFYNTPARMKFLKKDATEAGYIQDILTNLSLSKPEISFAFKKDNKEVFATIGDGDLKNTIAGLFGTEFAQELTAVNYSDGKYKISGYITLAHCSRQSRNMQFAFINGRYVKNKTIIAAVENAYKGSTMVGKFPGYVLNVQMPFEIVDVNVHPAKTEVRFANDGEIFSIVYRAVKIALGANTQLKEFSFTPKQPTTFFVDKENIVQQGIEENQPSQSLKINIVSKAYDNQNPAAKVWEDFPSDDTVLNSDKNITPYMLQNSCKQSDYIAPIVNSENVPVQQVDIKKETATTAQSEVQAQPEAISVIGELFNTYILCESGNSLIMVDKHAAHERLIYERLKRSQSCDNQMLLSPINIKLSAEEKEAILENLDVLLQQGFIIEDFGLSGVLLRAIPMNISSQDPQSLINEIAHNMVDNSRLTLSEKHESILHSVACRSAIKAGDRASNKELMELVKDIQQEKIPLFCPHGRPVIITITKKELEKQFGRA